MPGLLADTENQEHPRARGENEHQLVGAGFVAGTSPRTRGKRGFTYDVHVYRRNIPAHAGKTEPARIRFSTVEEHPRARGENMA